jgi:outer membrane protein assembly factor BamA
VYSGLVKYRFAFRALCLSFLLFSGSFSYAQSDNRVSQKGNKYTRIDSIILAGNKITRDQIMLREIVLKAGDFVRDDKLDSLIARSRENLMNTLLFNFVDMEKAYTDTSGAAVIVRVNVIERWYIWPIPILKFSDRNFNVWWETKDFSRLSYGFNIDWRNTRGRKDELVLQLQWGYDQVIGIQYLIPFLNKKETLGMEFGLGYARQRETAYQTLYNKQQFYKDPSGYARQDSYAYGQLLVRKNIYNTHYIQLRYDRHHFSDSLLKQNENFTIDSADDVQYLSFSYTFKSDHRDFKSYPLKGYYFDFGIVKNGLWTFNTNTINTFNFTATYRKYWELSPRVYFATGINGLISAGLHPYFILYGIGYDRDIVRSYEYYLVDARHFGILKNNIKFALIPNKVEKISFIRTDKFAKIYYALYLDVFFDAGYGVYNQDFGQETNDLQNTLLLGYGTGLDFVTYYDIVVRLEFSVNFKNEAGIFLHFRAPI